VVALVAQVEGIGILGPGVNGWPHAVSLLEGRSTYTFQPTILPVPEGLPPAERRRLGRVVKVALAVGLEATSSAGADPAVLPTVFASSGGDGQNCHEICQALSLEERLISPTRFHNSVHNAAAGYWSIATGSQVASNALGAFDASFAAGLLEAVTQVVVDRTRVLLVAYDAPYPPPLAAKRPIAEAFGVGFVLGPAGAANGPAQAGGPARGPGLAQAGKPARASTSPLGYLTLAFADAPPDRMKDPELESLRVSIPAARSLPLLYQLAVRQPTAVHIEYLDGGSLVVKVEPCT
jgi:hypothetical protein